MKLDEIGNPKVTVPAHFDIVELELHSYAAFVVARLADMRGCPASSVLDFIVNSWAADHTRYLEGVADITAFIEAKDLAKLEDEQMRGA